MNWYACTPGSGSLVTYTEGSVDCEVVKLNFNDGCSWIKPDYFGEYSSQLPLFWSNKGQANSQAYILFDGITSNYYPVHDHCASNTFNVQDMATNPRGAIYIR